MGQGSPGSVPVGGYASWKEWWVMAVYSFWNLHRRDRSKIFLYRYLFCVLREKCVAQREKKSSNLRISFNSSATGQKAKTLLI
jgi:hypothetical protein